MQSENLRRSAEGGLTSFAQIAADSLTLFLWYCTQCERVWMDCWLSDSFSSLLLNELAEKPAIKGSRASGGAGESAAPSGSRGEAGTDQAPNFEEVSENMTR